MSPWQTPPFLPNRSGLQNGVAYAKINKKMLQATWVDKHKPATLDDIVGNSENIHHLKSMIVERNTPNFIFVGPPGVGKSTCINCLAEQIVGNPQAIMYINASDERGVDIIRNRIKLFSQRSFADNPPVFKVVVFDEADAMTPGAQHALHRAPNTQRQIFPCRKRFCAGNNLTLLSEDHSVSVGPPGIDP